MTHIENPIRLVKELKGAALSILVLLGWSATPVSNEWLEIHSGYSDKPVSKALAYLQEHGFIQRTNAGWQISDGSRQLPLPIQQIDPGDTTGDTTQEVDSDPGSSSESMTIEPQNKLDTLCPSRNNSDSPLVSSISIKDINLKDSKILTTTTNSRKNSDSQLTIPEQLVASALAEHGIFVNARTRPLLGRITTDDIIAVAKELQTQGLIKQTGLFIVRLEQRADHPGVGFPDSPYVSRADPQPDPDGVQPDFRSGYDVEAYLAKRGLSQNGN